MASFVPQTVLPDLFVHHRDRSRLYQHALPSISTFPSATDATCSSSLRERPSSSRRGLQCAAITGGSKRDVEKLVARTQHRRPRHRKGVTPSNSDLLEELEMEEEGEEVVENEVTQLVSEVPSNDASEPSITKGEGRDLLDEQKSFEGVSGEDQDDVVGSPNAYAHDATRSPADARVKNTANDAAEGARGVLDTTEDTATNVVDTAADTQKQIISDVVEGAGDVTTSLTDSRDRNATNDATEGAKGILETTEDTATSVVDTAADTQKQVVSDVVEGGESIVGGINEAVNGQSTGSSSGSKGHTDEDRESNKSLTDTSFDTASYVGDKINETGKQVQEDISESASSVGEVFDSQSSEAVNAFREQANEAEASGKAVADVAKDTAEYVSEKVNETGKQLQQDFTEVASTGQSLLQDGSEVMSQQAKDFSSQTEQVLKEEGSLLEQKAARLQNEASKSLDRVQDSVQKAVQESARAARSIGVEALGIGELLVDTARETIQETSGFAENKGSKSDVTSKERKSVSQPQVSQKEDTSRFADFNVLVAGASGQTGRVIVEKLVSNGASVRALVRDSYKARSIQQLKDCECVEADLYKYETVKKAIGDCNVVVCAIGARAFPLDPFSTYQVEYEGVLNLISAARNQGKVKKFILISTIGVTYLQLVPLLFWKKQAELYLQRSGLDYTIVRPGGLRNTSEPEDVVMQGADSQFFGGISRKKVAEVCIAALTSSDASDKIVEVVSVPGSQKRSIEDLFKLV